MRVELVGGDPEAPAHVIFLHGLGGNWRTTWAASKDDSAWPVWLADADSQLAVWCLDYDAAATQWKGTSMPIRDRATSILGALVDARDLGGKPLILVGHSLGGLLIKQMVRHSQTMLDQYQNFADNLGGVVFFSTPHTGSGLASLASYIRSLRITPLVKELASNDPYLRELDDWYRNYAGAASIPTLSFYEKLRTKKLRVVDETSGDPHLPNSTAIPVDADHISVCKFEDPSDLVYLQVKRFILSQVSSLLQNSDHEAGQSRESVFLVASSQTDATSVQTNTARLRGSEALADIAILALVSDQLPTGGWTRSLARWMTRHAAASGTAAPNRPPMRVHGGIDVTCSALNRLVALGELSTPALRGALRPVLRSGTDFLRTRTPSSGAVGARIPQRTEPTEVRIRHTAVALATLIRVQEHLGEQAPYPEAVRCARYLGDHLQHWQDDTSSVFGTLAASWSLLGQLYRGSRILGANLADNLISLLSTTVEDMAQAMITRQLDNRIPASTAHEAGARFGSYGALSALSQSSFLFGAKQITSLRRPHNLVGLAEQRLYTVIVETCEVFARDVLSHGLLRLSTVNGAQPDVGLSIQCYSVLLDLADAESIDRSLIHDALNALYIGIEQALLHSSAPELASQLAFTHGEQLSALIDDTRIAHALTADTTIPEFVQHVSGRTMTQREIAAELLRRSTSRKRFGDPLGPSDFEAVTEVWSTFLDDGFYPPQQASQRANTRPWGMSGEGLSRIRSIEQDWHKFGLPTLWITEQTDVPPEEFHNPRHRVRFTRLGIHDWLTGSISIPPSGFAHVHLPTAATSESLSYMSSALKAAAAALGSPGAEGVMCVRLGDHRWVTTDHERVIFIEDVMELERLFHDCGLELVGTDVTQHDLSGYEIIARFRMR